MLHDVAWMQVVRLQRELDAKASEEAAAGLGADGFYSSATLTPVEVGAAYNA